VYPVGRLDADVQGVLLLTNDGALTHRLLHPRYALPRVYEADVAGRVDASDTPRWRSGVQLEDGFAQPLAVEIGKVRRGPDGDETTRLTLTFAEGRKHEVKRYCAALGHAVVSLRRIAFGPITLADLPLGQARELTRTEVSALRAAVTGPDAGRPR
jgi:pseudouridine synthase